MIPGGRRGGRQCITECIKVVLLLASLCLVAPGASADEPNRIDIAYLPPKNPAHQPLYELLTSRHVLEKIQALLSPFRLPRRVLLKVEGCDGVANAFSGDGAVTVCYEYID